MSNIGKGQIEVIKEHKNYQRYMLILLFMSAMVAGMVVLGLMQPAVTMTYNCGLAEHTHSIENGCYELICGMEEGELEADGVTPHVHSESCYDMTHTICGLPEHIHTDECFSHYDEEDDEVIEVTEAPTEPEVIEAPAEEITEVPEETEAVPDIVEIRDIDLGEIYALDHNSSELTAQQAGELTDGGLAYDLYDDVEELTYDEDSDIAEDTEKENAVQLTLKFRVPKEAFDDGNRTVYCSLPEEVSLGDTMTARRYMSEATDGTESYEICRYKLDPDKNMLIMEFSEEQVGDGSCTIVCKFRFDAIVSIDDPEAAEQTIKEGNAEVNVKAPDKKKVTIANDEPSLECYKYAEDETTNYNGGYHESNTRIKFRMVFVVRNGTNGQDVVLRDKLDILEGKEFDGTYKTFVDNRYIQFDPSKYSHVIRERDGVTEDLTYCSTDWCKYYVTNYLSTNLAEFVIDKDDFYNNGVPYNCVKYTIEYSAFINQEDHEHFIQYAAQDQNYVEILYADSEYKEPNSPNEKNYMLSNETGVKRVDLPVNQTLYRGYTVTQSSSFSRMTDKVTWTMNLHRGYDSYRIDGDINGLKISDDTLKNADTLTVSDGTNSETYTVNDNSKTLGTFDKTAGTFTFKSGATSNNYTFTYTNKADEARTTIVSQPLFSRASDDRFIAQSAIVSCTPLSRRAIFDFTNNNYSWSTAIGGPEGEFINRDYKVSLTAEQSADTHYMTKAQREALTMSFTDAEGLPVALTNGTDYSIVWYSDTNWQTEIAADSDADAGSFKVCFNDTDNAEKVCDADIDFDSSRQLNYFKDSSVAYDSKVHFTAEASWHPKDVTASLISKSASVEEKKECYYIVFDNTGNTAGDSVTYDDETDNPHYTVDITEGDDMIITWGIEGNYSAVYKKDGDITFNVTLPSGTTLITSGTNAPICTKYVNHSAQTAEFTYDYNSGTNLLTFTVPEGSRKDDSGNAVKFRLGYSVKLLSSVGNEGKSYTCDVTDVYDTDLSQKQTVKETVIAKSGVQGPNVVPANPIDGKTADLNEAYVKSHVITYTLKVNPQALTLNGGGKITVDDYMHYDISKGYRPVLKSLTVKDMTNGGRVLSDSEYTFSHRNTGLKASADERSNSANARYSGASIFLELNDSTYYEVTYVYHFRRNSSTDPLVTEKSTFYNEARLLADGTEYGYTKFDKEFTFGIYEDDQSDDYAVIEAVDSTNNNKKVSGCYFAFLRYNNDNWDTRRWEIMTGATVDSDGRIRATNWQTYEEIKRGSTPEDIMTKYGMTEGSLPLLGPTDSNGRTRLPEIVYEGSKDYMYRVVEIKPNPNYTVNPDKVYGLGKDDFSMDGFPSNVFKDRVTSIYITAGGSYDIQTGVVIIPNEPRLKRDITLNKEWADSRSSHDDVSFNLFRSYEAKTATITKTINFTLKDRSGRSKTTSIKAPYLGSFYITIKNCGMFNQNSDFKFTVNDHTVTKNDLSDSEKQFAKYDNCTIRNRADEDEVIAYFTLPHSTTESYDSSIGIETYSNGTDGDCAVWGNYVLKDLNIVLQAVDYDGSITNAEFVAPDFATEEYDTFDNIPEKDDRLKRKLDDGTEIYALTQLTDENGSVKEEYLPTLTADVKVTLGEGNGWTYTWHDLPDKDCYGYKYFYYIEELPGDKNEAGRSNAEVELNNKYNSDYQIRYFNNGAFNGDIITVRNHEKAFIKTLPATGGEGNDFYLGIGLSVVVFAVSILFLRKRSRGRISP